MAPPRPFRKRQRVPEYDAADEDWRDLTARPEMENLSHGIGRLGSRSHSVVDPAVSQSIIMEKWAAEKFARLRCTGRLGHLKVVGDMEDFVEELRKELVTSTGSSRHEPVTYEQVERLFLHQAVSALTEAPSSADAEESGPADESTPGPFFGEDKRPEARERSIASKLRQSSLTTGVSVDGAPQQQQQQQPPYTPRSSPKPREKPAQAAKTSTYAPRQQQDAREMIVSPRGDARPLNVRASGASKAKSSTGSPSTSLSTRQSVIRLFVDRKLKAMTKNGRLSRLEDKDEINLLTFALNDELAFGGLPDADSTELTSDEVSGHFRARLKETCKSQPPRAEIDVDDGGMPVPADPAKRTKLRRGGDACSDRKEKCDKDKP